jgi:hypothetical protein
MTVALFEIAAGAALIAFWIFHAAERAGFAIFIFVVVFVVVFISCFVSCAATAAVRSSAGTKNERRVPIRFMVNSSLFLRPRA